MADSSTDTKTPSIGFVVVVLENTNKATALGTPYYQNLTSMGMLLDSYQGTAPQPSRTTVLRFRVVLNMSKQRPRIPHRYLSTKDLRRIDHLTMCLAKLHHDDCLLDRCWRLRRRWSQHHAEQSHRPPRTSRYDFPFWYHD